MVQSVQPARVDRDALRGQIQDKYAQVATTPEQGFHFHTGAPLAAMLGYDTAQVASLPAGTVDSFAGTGNPLSLGALPRGATVVDLGCGAGFDALLAAQAVGPEGRVIAVDMTPAMLAKTAARASAIGLNNVETRMGFLEAIPVDEATADVVISNGVINLCPDKRGVLAEIMRVLRPGGRLQFADIANGQPVPEEAVRNIDLWTA